MDLLEFFSTLGLKGPNGMLKPFAGCDEHFFGKGFT